uniref:Uncharacterized protein n=1 Tax=Arundo donax TaxID=35708 RepID=A0A0A9C7U0_ARUDO
MWQFAHMLTTISMNISGDTSCLVLHANISNCIK